MVVGNLRGRKAVTVCKVTMGPWHWDDMYINGADYMHSHG